MKRKREVGFSYARFAIPDLQRFIHAAADVSDLATATAFGQTLDQYRAEFPVGGSMWVTAIVETPNESFETEDSGEFLLLPESGTVERFSFDSGGTYDGRVFINGIRDGEDDHLAGLRVGVEGEAPALFAALDSFAAAVEEVDPPAIEPPSPRIFIGHGGSQDWIKLRDFIESVGYLTLSFETLGSPGLTIPETLAGALDSASMAVLVLTAEDETADGELRARQNVVHEVGLFQGRLGFSRAIVVAEQATADFSNLSGILRADYQTGHIEQVFQPVLAELRRELGDPAWGVRTACAGHGP